MRVVNAIPAVVAAEPGICTTLNLPLVTGGGLYGSGREGAPERVCGTQSRRFWVGCFSGVHRRTGVEPAVPGRRPGIATAGYPADRNCPKVTETGGVILSDTATGVPHQRQL